LKDKNAFLELKGALEGLLKKLEIRNWKLEITEPQEKYFDEERFLSVIINGEEYGWLGELKETVYNQFNFKNRKVALFEINFDKLVLAAQKVEGVKYAPLPQFPSIIRDLAFEISWNVKWADVCSVILSGAKDPLVRSTEFLSEFGLGDKKSVAFRITYQADRTLKDEEVEVVEKKIIKMLGDKFNARLRAALGK
jgi:phenylalanyl-tRNA synthetase beta chain